MLIGEISSPQIGSAPGNPDGQNSDGLVVDDLSHWLHLVAVHVRGRVRDAALEQSELGREGLADGLEVGAEVLDSLSSCVVDGDELRHAV